ncbi:hypothetical protein HPP92_007374 [Vanilla planifolia]|uniref:BHLH domain-containing protein n=1 Tax=Vanilla planifolia TaxID=51239 RepID=A0A835VBT0_VANPL|nr:hypothetical protein HPP92_007374 [Vanilla planifolia]
MPCTTPFVVPPLLSPSLSLLPLLPLPLLPSEGPIRSDPITPHRPLARYLRISDSDPRRTTALPAIAASQQPSLLSKCLTSQHRTQHQEEGEEEEKHEPTMMTVTEMAEKKRRTNHDAFLLDAKRLKTEHGDLKKDKMGERVAALQRLVSPYGKSDTASVLTEATAYIKFLHEQLQVLSSPYLCSSPNSKSQTGEWLSLRNRGLCLMPLVTTVLIARSNGADIWAPVSK